MMRLLPLVLVLSACQEPPRLPPEVPAYLPKSCPATVKLPKPPADERSVGQLVSWARTAAKVANQAIAERDACALDYLQLRTACATAAGCIVKWSPP